MLVYITTYASPKTANATTSKSTPLMNTLLLLSLLHSGFEVNCGLNDDCFVDVDDVDEDVVGVDEDGNIVGIDTDGNIVGIDTDGNIVGIDTDGNIVGIDKDDDIVDIDTDEDIITEIKNNYNNALYSN